MWKKLAILSIVANLIFVLGAGFVVYSKGGIPFLMNFVTAQFASAESDNGFDPYYNTKLTIFEDIEKDIVMLGDSLTDNNEWSASFPRSSIANQGISSDTTDGVLYRLDLATKNQPSKIFLMIGVNDLVREKSQEDILKNYKEIISTIKKESPETMLFIQSVLPINTETSILRISNEDINALNKGLSSIANESDVTFIDLHSLLVDEKGELKEKWSVDGIHLNGDAYDIWETGIAKYLE